MTNRTRPTRAEAVRWWPLLGAVGLVLLGLVVGKGTTPLDQEFQLAGHATRPYSGWLLFFTDPRVMGAILAIAVGYTLWRKRWRLAAAVLLCPLLTVTLVRVLKGLFGRHKGGALSYPSGHSALVVTVLGMVVLAAGMVLWSRVLAGVFITLGLLGQAMTYHYFTDAIGSLLLGSAAVCIAGRLAGVPPDGGAPHPGI
ncbi:MAG: PA-phosphatase [Mycobacterium sp.]|nr:PA-phosphatase [Mycobacterium sp.]